MAAPKSFAQALDTGRWIHAGKDVTHPLTVGTHLIPLIPLPQGTRVLDIMFVQTVPAVNGSGTTVIQIQDDQSTPLVYIGATAINLESGTGITKLDTATTGGAAAALLRPEVPDDQMLNAEVVIATANATVSAVFDVYVLLLRDVPAVGP
jgi:vacuolar-type H+-ATPase catalytic subunit A/Vma1